MLFFLQRQIFTSLFDIQRRHLCSASEFPAVSTINTTRAQVPRARSPGQLNFVQWRLIYVGPQRETCFVSPFPATTISCDSYSVENLCTPDTYVSLRTSDVRVLAKQLHLFKTGIHLSCARYVSTYLTQKQYLSTIKIKLLMPFNTLRTGDADLRF